VVRDGHEECEFNPELASLAAQEDAEELDTRWEIQLKGAGRTPYSRQVRFHVYLYSESTTRPHRKCLHMRWMLDSLNWIGPKKPNHEQLFKMFYYSTSYAE